jgi:hypothetical protein
MMSIVDQWTDGRCQVSASERQLYVVKHKPSAHRAEKFGTQTVDTVSTDVSRQEL